MMDDWSAKKRVPIMGLGLGLVAGSLEVGVRTGSLGLHMSFGQGLLLSLVAALCMGIVALLMGVVGGWAVEMLLGDRERRTRNSIGASSVGLGLAVFYCFPLAESAWDVGATNEALLWLVLPLAAGGVVHRVTLAYMEREEREGPRRFGWVFWAPVASLLLALASATQVAMGSYGGGDSLPSIDDDAPTVVIVSIDTLRRDHLSVYGESPVETPGFDELANRGLLFWDAVSPMPETAPAHAAMMTGLHPVESGVLSNGHVLADSHLTLAERLSAEGYATSAFLSSIAVASRTGLNQGFEVYDEDFFPWVRGFSTLTLARVLTRLAMTIGDPTDYPYLLERPAPVTLDRALEWLEETSDRPGFSWIHLFDPHSPYEPHGLRGFEENGTGDAPALDHRSILRQEPGYPYTQEERERLRALYAEEVAWTDQQLSAFVTRMEQVLADRNWVLVVTADHGEMLGEHGIDFNHHGIYEDAIRVPLVIASRGIELSTGVVDPQVRLMDLPTTLLGMVGLDEASMGAGFDLRAVAAEEGNPGMASLLMGRKSRSLSVGAVYGARVPLREERTRLKYIRDEEGAESLYEVSSDPDEAFDLIAESANFLTEDGTVLDSLRELVDDRIGTAEAAEVEVEDDVREALEAIGYVE